MMPTGIDMEQLQILIRKGLENLPEITLGRRPEESLSGQVVLITGGSRGLGLLVARAFAEEGCQVAICARDADELERARIDLEKRGKTAFTVVCDIADQSAVEQMLRDVTAHFDRIDILVNNAGIIQVGPIESMTVEDFQEAMNVMFWGVLYPILAVLPQMQERRSGRIVNITSIGGKISPPHLLPYNSAKFAAVGLSEGLRAELARDGISVTTIVPGLMRTGSHLNAFFKGAQAKEYAWFALGATLPFISMDAERAASQIVLATKRGDAERVLGVPAILAARFHGLFPGITADAMGLVNSLLPDPPKNFAERLQGRDVEKQEPSALRDRLTTLGRSAAVRFNEAKAKRRR